MKKYDLGFTIWGFLYAGYGIGYFLCGVIEEQIIRIWILLFAMIALFIAMYLYNCFKKQIKRLFKEEE